MNALVVIGAIAFTTMLVAAGTVAYVVYRLRLRNRVVASVRTEAPLRWLVSCNRVARLHRRLRAAIAAAHLAQRHRETVGVGLDDVVAELSARAVDLDHQLLICHHAPATVRSRMLRELTAEVRELERIAERAIRLARAWAGDRPSERGLGPVRERLDALEAAVRELDGIEQLPVFEPGQTRRADTQ